MALTPDDLKAISDLLDQRLDQKLKPIQKDIRSLKLKVNKAWKLLEWFTKDADERIVGNTRRIEAVEKAIKQN
jgi:hypothetical protein